MAVKNFGVTASALLALSLFATVPCAAQKISLSGLPPADTSGVLARVGGKSIFLDEFIRRAEYTVRPPYCRGTGGIEKKIILNSLIAEKMLSMEAGADNELAKNKSFQRMVRGRKEQLMRNVLYYAEGTSKVRLDSSSLRNEYGVAGRTYHVEYFTVPDDSLAREVAHVLDTSSAAFPDVYRALAGRDTLPQRYIDWASKENRDIHAALFDRRPAVNQIVGPVPINDGGSIFMRVRGWTDRPAVTGIQVSDRCDLIREELSRKQADERYDRYILRLMRGKTIRFNPEAFRKFVEIVAPRYLATKKENEEALLDELYIRPASENPELAKMERALDGMQNTALLTVGGKEWTVDDVVNEMETHPLVFRNRNLHTKNIAEQIKLALVDMVRDRYLVQEAYKRGFDKYPMVTHYTAMWSDALIGLWQRQAYLSACGILDDGQTGTIMKYLDPYLDSLRHKYNESIEINADEFNSIELMGIPMFVRENNVPFPVFMPAFPQMTTHKWLDYGRKMSISGNK